MPILKPPKGAQLNRGHPLARGLVGYWLLNEGAGARVNDLSGNGSTGVITGAAWAAGGFGPCLNFNGTSDYVSGTFKRALSGSQSLAAWVNVTDITASRQIYRGASLGLYAHSANFWYAVDSTATITLTGSAVSLGKWVHLVVTVEATVSAKLYINGVLAVTDTTVGTPDATSSFYVGWNSGTQYMKGLIDHVYFWNRALTAGEITKLYREPYGMIARPRIEFWTGAMGGGAPPAVVPCPYYSLMMG